MTKMLDLAGQVFGRLTVIKRAQCKGRVRWVCMCECGGTKEVQSNHLQSGHITSCGCWLKESAAKRRKSHGFSCSMDPLERSTYQTWCSMHGRCSNTKRSDYARYGGKGIKVCKRWHKFENFIADMGVKPKRSFSIDRIDCKADYSPENCRWADALTQGRNRSNVIMVEYNGTSKPLSELCVDLGVKRQVVYERLRAGWDPVRAIETPCSPVQSA
jgi:hypothetical protein